MKKQAVILLWLGCVAAVSTSRAIDLKQSKVTQVVNDVQIISAGDQRQKSAAVNDTFSMPDILRTGAASRAELVAPDETVTRVGANTIFSFDPANRTINLKQGSLLFHSPHGKGGGTIQTGSATASVLGTTLIVTTTPNGGLKVLDLEGEVEVKFLNGLHQKLDPGQMTFILPGGDQLAPVIIFRLDALTQSSLLVKGFNQPLASLPLIQNQIANQIKLIQSGKATDTGLDVGDNAGPNQVEVLDPNTVNLHHSSTPLASAEGADATLNQSSLTDASIPTPPNHVFVDQPFAIPDNQFFASRQFIGYVARNIFMNSSVGNLLTVDLSPYASLPEFDLVALKNLNIDGSVTFAGFSPQSVGFSLIAGGRIFITQGSTVEADIPVFSLSAAGALTLNGVNFVNPDGHIILNIGSDISLDNTSIHAYGTAFLTAQGNLNFSGSTINADTAILSSFNGSMMLDSGLVNASYSTFFSAADGITINGTSINARSIVLNGGNLANGAADASIAINNSSLTTSLGGVSMTSQQDITIGNSTIAADPAVGTVSMNANAGSVSVTGTSITAHYLTVNSGDGILLDASGKTLFASGSGAKASFTAPNLITVKNADFSAFAVLNMAANTINLNAVAFGAGSSVTLRSLNGVLAPNPNTGAVSVPGDVNFINNVTYGSNPAQNYINNGITVTTLH